MNRYFRILCAGVAVCLAFLPATAPAQQSAEATPASVTTQSAATDPGYRLATGDQLHITVYNEMDLSGDYNVDDRGYLRLPLIGETKAQGLTLVELEQSIEAKFGQGYLKSPRISAQITSYRPFYIIGEVNKPGQYAFVNGMNAVTAVAIAGGYTYRASQSDIYIRRNGATEEESAPADEKTQIRPGDIVRVAERFF